MDKEFHYDITFILSRKAGLSSEEAYTLSYASQYTDDNKYHYHVNRPDTKNFINSISQTIDITKPSEKRQRIYPVFHFIPGGEEAEDLCPLEHHDEKCLITIPNSDNAQSMMKSALRSGDLYRIGIAVHALADTWSHQNFIGSSSETNKGSGLDVAPNIGHADFFHKPDIIHKIWTDCRFGADHSRIDNNDRFLSAARQIFVYLYRFKHPGSDEDQANAQYDNLKLEHKLKSAMRKTFFSLHTRKARLKAYSDICPELGMTQFQYDEDAWRHSAIEKKKFELDIFDRYWARESFETSHWYKFQMAVIEHREVAMKQISPLFKRVGKVIF